MGDLATSLWTLPGPNRYVRNAGMQLRDHFNIIFLVPALIDRKDFRQSLLNCLENELQIWVRVFDLADSNSLSPFELLKESFPGLKKYKNLEASVQDSSLPGVILLDNFEGCPLLKRHEWLLALSRWADASSRCSGKHSLALIATHRAMEGQKLPNPELKLVYSVWSGMPSALDVQVLCRLKTERQDAESQWRENLLASLAGNDLNLADRLWDVILEGEEKIYCVLCQYALEKGWDPGQVNGELKNWRPMPPGSDLSNILNSDKFRLLGRGITIFTPEYGEEIHSALIALLNRKDELNHRIWRAQANLILPLIDDARRRICGYLIHTCAEGWGYEFPVELGPLGDYIRALDNRSWVKCQWGTGVNLAQSLRNKLAHYETISPRSYHDFWRFYIGVHNILYQ